MREWGQILTISSLVLTGYGMMIDTSLETASGERILNLGLMHNQQNIFIGAGVAFVSGILLIGFSYKSSGMTRICPFCAEDIKSNAKICRFCQKELPELNPDSINENNNNGWGVAVLKVLLFSTVFYTVAKLIEIRNRSIDAQHHLGQLLEEQRRK